MTAVFAALVVFGVVSGAHARLWPDSFLSVGSGPQAVSAVYDSKVDYPLPPGMFIGAGVSAFQTEGAWNESGKAESMLDRLFHSKWGQTKGGSPDVATDSYHRYKDDVAVAKKLKLQVYRFSISWPRLLPTSDPSRPNEAGRRYYHALLDEITDNGLTPLVTLYHFDHPMALQEQFAGWQSREMIDKFKLYADYVFREYGSKIKYWTTLNEPNVFCPYYKWAMTEAELIKPEDWDVHRCVHHLILAHGHAYRIYRDKYHATQQGMVGWSPLYAGFKPHSDTPEDGQVVDLAWEAYMGIVMHPVVFGDYPDLLKTWLPDKLLAFTDAEKAMLKGSSDYMGFNFYSEIGVSYGNMTDNLPLFVFYHDLFKGLPLDFTEAWNGPTAYDTVYEEGLEKALLSLWYRYRLPVMLTETGSGLGRDEDLHDWKRAELHSTYIRVLVSVGQRHNIPVLGYCAWSLLDCFEWSAGYSRLFGLVHVNFTTQERSLKESSKFFIEMGEQRVVPFVAPSAGSSFAASVSIVLAFVLVKIL